jgi:hypothetical protein
MHDPGSALIIMVTIKHTDDSLSQELERIIAREASLLDLIRNGENQSKIRQRFRRLIYHHYETLGRDFPWRNTDNPYHILVSEVMLQQTPHGY